MMKTLYLFLATLILIIQSPTIIANTIADDALRQLDEAMKKRHEHINARKHTDDSLKSILIFTPSAAERAILYERIGRRYSEFQNDSAIVYLSKAVEEARVAGLESETKRFEALLLAEYVARGQVIEGLAGLAAIDTTGMKPYDRRILLGAAMRIYYSSSVYFPGSERRDELLREAESATRNFLDIVKDTVVERRYVSALLAALNGETELAEAQLNEIIRNVPKSGTFYAMAHELIGIQLTRRGLKDEAFPHLVDAATTEMANGVRTGTSTALLARYLLDNGQTDRGLAMLEIAIENAQASNTKQRFNDVAELSPLLTESLRQSSTNKTIWIITLSSLLAIFIAAIIVYFIRARKARAKFKRIISYFNYSDEERRLFFTGFLKLCALYIESFEEFARTAKRKIKAGQYDDLQKMMNSGDMLDRQVEKFYRIFDTAFFMAYPGFVDDINSLLLPDKQVTTPGPNELTTELRVLAFMRIGF
ncbi:MAG: DUF6377 domain-containing protein, partial [Roseburia sp.]|nr:DUF6377 domain-containing protein [Roseburia sp.]